jgi:hypothetical protein
VRLALPLAALILALPVPAAAYEGQWSLGADLGYGNVTLASALPAHGVGIGVVGGMGLWDVWELRARAEYVFHPAEHPLHVGILGAELLYLLDVLEIVPYFGAGPDVIGTALGGAAGADFAMHVTLGADWLIEREYMLGFDLRGYLLLTEVFSTGSTDPVYLTASVRFSFVFDR